MVLQDFNHCARLVPLGGVASCLVLNQDYVAAFEGGEALRVLVPSVAACDGPLGECSRVGLACLTSGL